MEHIDEAEPLPFFEFGVTRWTLSTDDDPCFGWIELETHPEGHYLIGGKIGGEWWQDDDGEDFYLADADALLDFLKGHGLLSVLTPDA